MKKLKKKKTTISLFKDLKPIALNDLLAEIHSCTMALPDFTRDFDWEPITTQHMITAIANNYPAARCLLRVRDANGLFAAREFKGAPKLEGQKHTFLVLDGQQCLTSLYQAFYGVGKHRYYLNLRKLIDGSGFEEAIFHVRASTKWVKEHETFDMQAKELTLPLSVLKGGLGEFRHWVRRAVRRLSDKGPTALEDTLYVVEEKWLKTIEDYHFPIITLTGEIEPDTLSDIFQSVSRTDVKLSRKELEYVLKVSKSADFLQPLL